MCRAVASLYCRRLRFQELLNPNPSEKVNKYFSSCTKQFICKTKSVKYKHVMALQGVTSRFAHANVDVKKCVNLIYNVMHLAIFKH